MVLAVIDRPISSVVVSSKATKGPVIPTEGLRIRPKRRDLFRVDLSTPALPSVEMTT